MELLVSLITLYVGLCLFRRTPHDHPPAHARRVRQGESAARVLRDGELGLAALRLPARWRASSCLDDQAAIQAAEPLRQRFATVTSHSRADFESGLDLSDHAGRSLTRLSHSLRLIAINGPVERTVAGCRALQFELEGYQQGVRQVYLHTTIEGRRAVHHVIAWSTRSAYDRRVFDELVDGFEELPGPDPQMDAPPILVEAQPQSRYAFH